MGKRKSAKRVVSRKKDKLDTVFDCPDCNARQSVECKLNKKSGVGVATCRACGLSHTSQLTAYSAPIDIYTEWTDAYDGEAPEDLSYQMPIDRNGDRHQGEYENGLNEDAVARDEFHDDGLGDDFLNEEDIGNNENHFEDDASNKINFEEDDDDFL